MSARAAAFVFALSAVACTATSTPGPDRLETPSEEPPRESSVADPELPADPSANGDDTLKAQTPPATDAPEPAPETIAPTQPCDLTKPFGALEALPFDTSAYETGGRFSADELTFYFARRSSTGTMQPMIAKRASKDEPWGKAVAISALDSTKDDSYLTTADDGLTGFFVSSRLGDLDIFRTTRASITATWTAPVFLIQLSTTSAEDDAWLVPTGSALYFDSNRTGNWELYRAPIDESGAVGAPAIVPGGPTTVGDETNPVVTPDELTMYFSRTTNGQADIRVAHRANLLEPWGMTAPVTELDSTANDRVTWVSSDGCSVVVSSTRAGGAGSSDLYLAAKPR